MFVSHQRFTYKCAYKSNVFISALNFFDVHFAYVSCYHDTGYIIKKNPRVQDGNCWVTLIYDVAIVDIVYV